MFGFLYGLTVWKFIPPFCIVSQMFSQLFLYMDAQKCFVDNMPYCTNFLNSAPFALNLSKHNVNFVLFIHCEGSLLRLFQMMHFDNICQHKLVSLDFVQPFLPRNCSIIGQPNLHPFQFVTVLSTGAQGSVSRLTNYTTHSDFVSNRSKYLTSRAPSRTVGQTQVSTIQRIHHQGGVTAWLISCIHITLDHHWSHQGSI